MKTKTKRTWLAVTLLSVFAIAVGLLWKEEPPQVVTYPNGNQYRFAGVSYGTRHSQPTLPARLVSAVPSPLTNLVQRLFGKRFGPITSFRTAQPALVVWFEAIGTNRPMGIMNGRVQLPMAVLADQDGVAGGRFDHTPLFLLGQWPHARFQLAPRRSRELQCVFLQGQEELGRVRFRNPLFRKYPQWQPEPLPAVKNAGEVEARLERLTTRIPRMNPGRVPDALTAFDVAIEPRSGSNERWEMHTAELSDATGNRISGAPVPHASLPGFALPGVFWPGEAAWRLKLELKRSSHFSPTELATFTNVPVPAVGSSLPVPLTNMINGVQVALTGFVHRPEFTNNPILDPSLQMSGVVAMLPDSSAGVSLDFVSIITQTGERLDVHQHVRIESRYYVHMKSIPTNATTMDITFVVQKTRTVEFLVKPPKAQ